MLLNQLFNNPMLLKQFLSYPNQFNMPNILNMLNLQHKLFMAHLFLLEMDLFQQVNYQMLLRLGNFNKHLKNEILLK